MVQWLRWNILDGQVVMADRRLDFNLTWCRGDQKRLPECSLIGLVRAGACHTLPGHWPTSELVCLTSHLAPIVFIIYFLYLNESNVRGPPSACLRAHRDNWNTFCSLAIFGLTLFPFSRAFTYNELGLFNLQIYLSEGSWLSRPTKVPVLHFY